MSVRTMKISSGFDGGVGCAAATDMMGLLIQGIPTRIAGPFNQLVLAWLPVPTEVLVERRHRIGLTPDLLAMGASRIAAIVSDGPNRTGPIAMRAVAVPAVVIHNDRFFRSFGICDMVRIIRDIVVSQSMVA